MQGRSSAPPQFLASPSWRPQGRLAASLRPLPLSYSPPVEAEVGAGTEKDPETWCLDYLRRFPGELTGKEKGKRIHLGGLGAEVLWWGHFQAKNAGRGAHVDSRALVEEAGSVIERALDWQCRTVRTPTRSLTLPRLQFLHLQVTQCVLEGGGAGDGDVWRSCKIHTLFSEGFPVPEQPHYPPHTAHVGRANLIVGES